MNKQEEDICEICLSGTSDAWECPSCGKIYSLIPPQITL